MERGKGWRGVRDGEGYKGWRGVRFQCMKYTHSFYYNPPL